MGWYELPQRLHKRQRSQYVYDSGAGKNPYSGAMIGVALKMGLVKTHVRKTRVMYAVSLVSNRRIVKVYIYFRKSSLLTPGGQATFIGSFFVLQNFSNNS